MAHTLEASITMTAQSAAISVRYVSSEKSCPGVSRILIHFPSYSNCNTEEVTEILFFNLHPVRYCMFEFALPFTDPAVLIAPPYELLSQRCLTGIRMRNDRKGSSAADLLLNTVCHNLFPLFYFYLLFTFLRILSHIITPLLKFLLILIKIAFNYCFSQETQVFSMLIRGIMILY